MKKNKPVGMTLFEIIVSAVLLSVTTVGIANLFISGKRLIAHSRSRMSSGELGQVFIDPLHMLVRQDTWATNKLIPGTTFCDFPAHNLAQQQQTCPTVANRILHGINFSAQYVITDLIVAAGAPPLRKVVTTITWTERQG